MQCICLLALVAVAGVVNGRSLHVASGYAAAPPHHLLPNPYYPQPYSYPAPSPYGYGYQTRPLIYSPPGSYFDNVYGLRKPLPGGGNPVAVDYVGSNEVLTLLSPSSLSVFSSIQEQPLLPELCGHQAASGSAAILLRLSPQLCDLQQVPQPGGELQRGSA